MDSGEKLGLHPQHSDHVMSTFNPGICLVRHVCFFLCTRGVDVSLVLTPNIISYITASASILYVSSGLAMGAK